MLTANVENMLVTNIGRTLETDVVPTQYILMISTVHRQSEVSIQRWIEVSPIVNFCCTSYIYCWEITFSTLGRRLGLLYSQCCKNAGILQSTTGSEYTLDRPCTFTVGKLHLPQSEEGWACCTPNVVKTLVFYSRLSELNGHWIDLVHPQSENYFFHSFIRTLFHRLFILFWF